MNDENKNNQKKPVEGKDYRVDNSEEGVTRIFNLNHPANQKKEEFEGTQNGLKTSIKDYIPPTSKNSKDILNMIRKRSNYNPSANTNKLRDFLNNLDEDTCEVDYRESDLYTIGWQDGEEAGYEIANQKFQDELRSLRTMIDAMINSR